MLKILNKTDNTAEIIISGDIIDDADGDFAYRGFDSGNWQDSRFPADPYSRPDGGKPGDRPGRR